MPCWACRALDIISITQRVMLIPHPRIGPHRDAMPAEEGTAQVTLCLADLKQEAWERPFQTPGRLSVGPAHTARRIILSM